jgi:hypothetical protein
MRTHIQNADPDPDEKKIALKFLRKFFIFVKCPFLLFLMKRKLLFLTVFYPYHRRFNIFLLKITLSNKGKRKNIILENFLKNVL